MERKLFKQFREIIRTADFDDQVWWDGYLFINLTEKQSNEIVKIMISRGFTVDNDVVYMPSGMGLRIINPFETWLTDGKDGGALEMLDKYRMPEEKSMRLDGMKGVLHDVK